MAVSLRRLSGTTEADISIPHTAVLLRSVEQCLVLGHYTTANTCALEALVLHLQSSFLTKASSGTDAWFEMGAIIQLAFRMGYHRDPQNLSRITVFDGEMKRRVWHNIFQIDALSSFQSGFTSMIPTESCDTMVPRNLEYGDLRPEMTELPPSRPLSENTPMRYMIVKSSVMEVFRKIVKHTQSLSTPTWDQIWPLDAEMRDTYGKVPESFQQRDVCDSSFLDQSYDIWQRCTIEILHLKGLIILHRRHAFYETYSPETESSRRACVEAALDILRRQDDLNKSCEPGGRLYEDRWMGASIPSQDYLLAAMVVCLDLSVSMRSRWRSDGDAYIADQGLEALRRSKQIWEADVSGSPEAQTAALALDVMIWQVSIAKGGTSQTTNVVSEPTSDVGSDGEQHADFMSLFTNGFESIDWVSQKLDFESIILMKTPRPYLTSVSKIPTLCSWIPRLDISFMASQG